MFHFGAYYFNTCYYFKFYTLINFILAFLYQNNNFNFIIYFFFSIKLMYDFNNVCLRVNTDAQLRVNLHSIAHDSFR